MSTALVCEGLRRSRLGRVQHEPFWYLDSARIHALITEVSQPGLLSPELSSSDVPPAESMAKTLEKDEKVEISSIESSKVVVSTNQLATTKLKNDCQHAIQVFVEKKQQELERIWSTSLEEKLEEIRLSPRKYSDLTAVLSPKSPPPNVDLLKKKLDSLKKNQKLSTAAVSCKSEVSKTEVPVKPELNISVSSTEELEKRQKNLSSLTTQLSEVVDMLGSINELVERSNIPPGDGRLANLNETVKQLQSKISQFRSALSRIEQSPVDSSWIEECRNLQAKIVSIAKVVLQLKKATEGLIEGLTPPKSASKPEEIPVLKAPNETKTNLPPHLLHCTSEKALKLRMKLDEIQLETEKTTEGLRTDPSLKKLKFDLVKAVVSPLNTLSNESLHSVIDRIMAFFSGNPVEIDTQDRTISLQKHPKSFTFCCEALAKHIVKQAEDILAVHPESAYPLAALIVALWSKWNDFGLILMAQIYGKFPYLLPFYPPKLEEYNDEDYYRAQGYKYIDGVVEKYDQFLKRLMGVTRLFAALSVTPVPLRKGVENPFSIGVIWSLVATLTNLPARPDITATMLTEILKIAGHKLREKYRRQFEKLIVHIRLEFLARIEEVSSDPASRATLTVLEAFLRDGEGDCLASLVHYLLSNFAQLFHLRLCEEKMALKQLRPEFLYSLLAQYCSTRLSGDN